MAFPDMLTVSNPPPIVYGVVGTNGLPPGSHITNEVAVFVGVTVLVTGVRGLRPVRVGVEVIVGGGSVAVSVDVFVDVYAEVSDEAGVPALGTGNKSNAEQEERNSTRVNNSPVLFITTSFPQSYDFYISSSRSLVEHKA
jgi:hypothetical protein